jgi:hypothetical protein
MSNYVSLEIQHNPWLKKLSLGKEEWKKICSPVEF